MFLGEYRHSLDAKGRLIIPAKDRHKIAEGCVITRGYEACLNVYTRADFQRIYHKALEQSPTDPETRDLFRSTFSRAVEAELDSAGRINIPMQLREYAGLEGEVVLLGSGLYLELWSRERWEEKASQMDELNSNPARFIDKDLAVGKLTE